MPTPSPSPAEAPALDDVDVRRRFEWARKRGHPRYVWPELDMSAWLRASRAVARTVADVLTAPAGGRAVVLREPEGPEALGIAAFTTGTGPLLGHWLAAGRLQASVESAAVLSGHLGQGRGLGERIGALVAAAAEVLGKAGVPATLLKGAHTALAYFPAPGTRPAADVDLLVRFPDFPTARRALEGAGFREVRGRRTSRGSVYLPPGEDGRIHSLHVAHARNPLHLDLHVSLRRDYYGVRSVDIGPVTDADRVAVPGAPAEVSGLRAPLLHLSLATHASEDLHNLQLVRLVELVWVGRSLDEAAWREVARRGREAGALRFAYPALALADRLAPGSVAAELLDEARAEAPSRMLRVVDRLRPGTAQRIQHLTLEERLMWSRGARETARRFVHMIWPESAGGSVRALAGIYRDRAYRLMRGRVSLRARANGRTDG